MKPFGIGYHNLRKICILENIEITMHAARRLEQRGISVNDKLIHTVIGSNQSQLWIVTAYYPDINKWSEDFRVRKED
ncbi:hypothetical protein DXC97_18700 [Lachnospiraceae bacterium TF09-5]|nr:hypothetical protein DXC97_18700 [Lachnospiraceae bacterium TF09-5]